MRPDKWRRGAGIYGSRAHWAIHAAGESGRRVREYCADEVLVGELLHRSGVEPLQILFVRHDAQPVAGLDRRRCVACKEVTAAPQHRGALHDKVPDATAGRLNQNTLEGAQLFILLGAHAQARQRAQWVLNLCSFEVSEVRGAGKSMFCLLYTSDAADD